MASCVSDLALAKVVNVLILSKSWAPSTNPFLLYWKCSSTRATFTASSRLSLLSPSWYRRVSARAADLLT